MMAISGGYSTPVTVNGYTCRNCTDVDNATKHIDPAKPFHGPYDVNERIDEKMLKLHKTVFDQKAIDAAADLAAAHEAAAAEPGFRVARAYGEPPGETGRIVNLLA